jgi:biopolymer transport protein ExbD
MAMNIGSQSGARAVINVTPMIDVLLVLLIIFMAIAPQEAVGLDALAPSAPRDAQATPQENSVVLEVGADGGYRLNTTAVAASGLADRLREIYSLRANRILFVKAAPGLEFQTVASAMDTARAAGVDRVALMPR